MTIESIKAAVEDDVQELLLGEDELGDLGLRVFADDGGRLLPRSRHRPLGRLVRDGRRAVAILTEHLRPTIASRN